MRFSGHGSLLKVLDMGCGFGGTSRHLTKLFPQSSVEGEKIKLLGTRCINPVDGSQWAPFTLLWRPVDCQMAYRRTHISGWVHSFMQQATMFWGTAFFPFLV